MVIYCGVALKLVVDKNPHIRAYKTELREIIAAMNNGDNLPNTPASLQAKVSRRALLVAVHYEGDMRNTQDDSLLIPTSPLDVCHVYRMLLTRGYEPQNIRILMDGVVRNYLTDGTKQNITDSLEWLFHSAEAGDHRYFHFSGHGYAYEVEEGEGKMARVRLAPSSGVGHEHPNPIAHDEQPSLSPRASQDKFYREALLTRWDIPTLIEIDESEEPIILDAHNRINDQAAKEFRSMVSKLPKGCVLTITLDCLYGAQMNDINRPYPVCLIRGGASWPSNEQEAGESSMSHSNTYPNTSPRNLFVPPVFHLYSDFSFDPNVTMERVQGPEVLDGVEATVFVWSGYSNSVAQAGTFTSAFTAAVQEVEGDITHCDMLQKISRKVAEATEGKDDQPVIQLWSGNGGETGALTISFNVKTG
ncbi:unnamed protein product [Rhizoctonia solani]|uniref:ICE-like protease (Caspase) p20 domain protein n=1 Tax=Rhizoctonia solani TaxID=456999 RepID=A0A8H3DI59_9AGAM|nr:unnamed protein product [Rhizoctonia solani]